jgi:GDPmannose 4,6-dehydratase
MKYAAFITGISGQDGSYLAELLLDKGYAVYGIVRRTSTVYTNTRIDHIRSKITLEYGDMTDTHGLSGYLRRIVKENSDMEVLEVYNLAAQSHVAVSFEIPEYTTDVDGMGVLRLLEAVRSLHDILHQQGVSVKFYQAGTSEMYGAARCVPQTIDTPFNPVSPYAASKVYAYFMTKMYRTAYGMYCTNGILFNHESPRRGWNFVTMKVVNGAEQIARGNINHISLGNLDSKRDWGHAKDYVRGMWLMMQQNKPNDYLLATGETYSVRTFVEKVFEHHGLTLTWRGNGIDEEGLDQNGIVRVNVNPKYFRPCEVDILQGDPSKAENELGWTREYDLHHLVSDMVNYAKQTTNHNMGYP